MQGKELQDFVVDKLGDIKAKDIVVLDVRGKSDITDCMIICSGTSNRHVRSIADKVAEEARHAGVMPFGVDGDKDAEWILVDLGEVMVHVMQDEIRDRYQLEKLWGGNIKAA